MKKRRILSLANRIEKFNPPRGVDGFNLSQWCGGSDGFDERDKHTDCNSAGCIAGWTVAIWQPENANCGNEVFYLAQELLGLDRTEARDLMVPSVRDLKGIFRHQITRESAVLVLRHFAKTGVVDWHVAPQVRASRYPFEEPIL